MHTWVGRMPWAVGWLLFSASCFAAPPSADQLRGWVLQLDAADFALREQAGQNLAAAGEPAIAALCVGVVNDSAEVSWRAVAALEQIALSGNEATLARVAAALEKTSEQGKPGLALRAKELQSRYASFRRERAVAKIRSLGGKFEGDKFEGDAGFGALVRDGVIPLAAIDIALNAGGALLADGPALALPDPPPDLPADAILPAADDLPAAAEEGFIGEAFAPPLFAAMVGSNEGETSLTIDQDWRGGDAELAVLGELPHITSLQLHQAPLSDAAMAQIAALPRLVAVEIDGTPITAAALNTFRQQKPQVRVFALGSAMLGILADITGACRVTGVVQGSGAAEAGLKEGDEIVAVENRPVRDFSDLTIAIFGRQAGEKLSLEFNRDGKKLNVDVVLKERLKQQ